MPQFVCRAGGKLAAALDAFGIDVSGVRALDSGLSTGGFTDCLLQRGAAHVTGVDVGYGQARFCAWTISHTACAFIPMCTDIVGMAVGRCSARLWR